MDGPVVQAEAREGPGPSVVARLPLDGTASTAGELLRDRVLHATATLPKSEQQAAVRRALDAFAHNIFLLIINCQRVADSATRFTLTAASRVRFWRTLPPIGG